MAVLETRGLTHVFSDGTVAIREIDLSIGEGEFVVIAGTNGSGKTVLVRHFNGLLLPTKGQVFLDGIPVREDLTAARKKVGLVFQNSDSQIIGQTVAEDVAFGPENLGLPRIEVEQRVRESLLAVGLEGLDLHPPRTLSGGQKRRLAVAGILAMEPEILVFDEPFTGLDYPGVVQVLRRIVSLHQKGHTVIVVTHELEKILAHADRLIVLDQGRIVENGQPAPLVDELEKYGIKKPYGDGRKVETMTWLN